MAYPKEFRRAVAAAYDACGSSLQVAAQFHCSPAWVRRLIQRRRELHTLDRSAKAKPAEANLPASAIRRGSAGVFCRCPARGDWADFQAPGQEGQPAAAGD